MKTKNKTLPVNFNILRYANCWEDAEILLKGLAPAAGSKILSIGSAGDNSFSLLTTNPQIVVAIDISSVQLHLIELKKACFANLSYDQTLHFLGFLPAQNRLKMYAEIRHSISAPAKEYWDTNTKMITEGVIFEGKFEKYLRMFSQKILPYIHSRKNTSTLFQEKTDAQQEYFYNHSWNTLRWRLFFRIFFSKYVMGKFGRDPQFLKEVEINVSRYIYAQAGKYLSSAKLKNNAYLHFMLQGNFNNVLPHYMREENFETIKNNLSQLILQKGYVQDATIHGKFNCFNLSNIFEYMNAELFQYVSQNILKMAEQNARLAYWNLMVPRQISAVFPRQIQYLQAISNNLHTQDNCFFYSRFIVEETL